MNILPSATAAILSIATAATTAAATALTTVDLIQPGISYFLSGYDLPLGIGSSRDDRHLLYVLRMAHSFVASIGCSPSPDPPSEARGPPNQGGGCLQISPVDAPPAADTAGGETRLPVGAHRWWIGSGCRIEWAGGHPEWHADPSFPRPRRGAGLW